MKVKHTQTKTTIELTSNELHDWIKRTKEIAILILSTTLFPPNVEQIAGFMVGLNERKQDKNNG